MSGMATSNGVHTEHLLLHLHHTLTMDSMVTNDGVHTMSTFVSNFKNGIYDGTHT